MADFVSVPHDPTPEMQTVGAGELARLAESGLDDREICDVIYRAMVDEFLYPTTVAAGAAEQ